MKQNLTTPIATGSTTGAHVLSFVDYIQLRRDLLIGVHSVNKRFGAHLTEEDCEDIVQNLLEFFVEKCQQGIYDSNISTPIEYLMGKKRVWGPVQKLVKIKLSQKQLPAASVDDMDDECGCTVILTGSSEVRQKTPSLRSFSMRAATATEGSSSTLSQELLVERSRKNCR